MFIFKSVVVVTSAALIASGALTASSAPAPAAGSTTQHHPAASGQLNPGPLAAITRSLAVAQLSPAKTAAALEKQLASVRTALQDAEAAALDPPGGRHGFQALRQALGLDIAGAEGEAGAAGA